MSTPQTFPRLRPWMLFIILLFSQIDLLDVFYLLYNTSVTEPQPVLVQPQSDCSQEGSQEG